MLFDDFYSLGHLPPLIAIIRAVALSREVEPPHDFSHGEVQELKFSKKKKSIYKNMYLLE